MNFTTDSVRNVSISGHGGSGKTTLFERLLFAGGVIPKPETVESGKTVSDSAPEELEHRISIHACLANIPRTGRKINIFDTPGSADFVGDVILTYRASEFALVAADGRAGVQIETIKLWRNLEGRRKPRGIAVTKLDDDKSDFARVLADVKEKFKADPVPFSLPMGSGAGFKGVIDVLKRKAYLAGAGGSAAEAEAPVPGEYQKDLDAAFEKLVEAAAEGDDALMEKFLEAGTLDAADVRRGLAAALSDGKFVPAFAVSALRNSGLVTLLDFFAGICPPPPARRRTSPAHPTGRTRRCRWTPPLIFRRSSSRRPTTSSPASCRGSR